jgi:hypothetical protein
MKEAHSMKLYDAMMDNTTYVISKGIHPPMRCPHLCTFYPATVSLVSLPAKCKYQIRNAVITVINCHRSPSPSTVPMSVIWREEMVHLEAHLRPY